MLSDRIGEQIPALRRYARALCGDRDRADDLVQETLLRALARSGQWRPGSDLRAWLFTILHNLFVSDCRRERRWSVSNVTGDRPECGASVETAGVVRDVERGLQTLPPEQRETLLLVVLEGLSYEETARVLGVPKGTVMSRLHRARSRLQAWMEGEDRSLKVVR